MDFVHAAHSVQHLLAGISSSSPCAASRAGNPLALQISSTVEPQDLAMSHRASPRSTRRITTEGRTPVSLAALGFKSVTQAACSSLRVVQANSASNRTSSPPVTGTAVASPTGRQVQEQVQPGGSSPRQDTGMSTSTPHSASSSLR